MVDLHLICIKSSVDGTYALHASIEPISFLLKVDFIVYESGESEEDRISFVAFVRTVRRVVCVCSDSELQIQSYSHATAITVCFILQFEIVFIH